MKDDRVDLRTADVGLLSPFWAGAPITAATSDQAIVSALVEVELALLQAYARLQLAPESVPASAGATARSLAIDPAELAAHATAGGNPVIPLVGQLRAAVATRDPDAAAWVHRGATSQDILDTALMVTARGGLDLVLEDVQRISTALAALADHHRRTIMVARTLTQHSVPTTFGLKVAGWLHGVVQAGRRLIRTRTALPVQWGGAGGTLASFTVLGRRAAAIAMGETIADQLGLRPALIPWHTQRAPVTDVGDAATQLTDALGKIACDVVVLARPEIDEVQEPRAGGRGISSAMPQKRNPVLSVLIKAAARRAPAVAATLHECAVAVDERPDGAWHAEWSAVREALRLAGGSAHLAAELTSGLIVNADAMRMNLLRDGPLVVTERLMLEFGPLIGRARLQELVDAAAQDHGVNLARQLRAEPALTSITDEHLAKSLDPLNYLGAADDLVDRVLEDFAAHGLKG
ncbi:lyase family protein [Nitrospira sp. Nam74]